MQDRGKMKAPAALSTKKPPEPTDSHTAIDEWIRRSMPDLQPILKYIDEVIRENLPGVHFAFKWKKAYYGAPDPGWILELVAYDVSVNIVFFAGAELDPPPPLGSEGRSRYIKLKTLEEAQGSPLQAWIQQASGIAGWK